MISLSPKNKQMPVDMITKIRRCIYLACGLGLASLLSACMTPLAKEELIAAPEVEIKKEDVSPAVSTEPVVNLPVRSVLTAERIALNDGIRLYNEGNFNAAIKRLGGAAEIWAADKPAQLEALKYMAFSYCVSSRQALCRQQFEKALRLDPSFDLAPGEKGHPLWGPAFARSKKNR